MKLVRKQIITGHEPVSKARQGLTRALLLGAAIGMTVLSAASASAQAEPKVVALTAGSCPVVSDGDIVTFDWNPIFDRPGEAKGLLDFGLGFARALPEDHLRGIPAPLKLEAHTRVHSPTAEGSAITGESNGTYHVRFRVHSQGLPAGTYELVEASAIPKVDATEPGDRPQMTNSPLQARFCLELTATPPHRGGL